MSAALDAMDVETAAPATAPFIVVPGQDVTEHITSTLSAMTASASASTTVKLGAGLLQARQQVLVTKAGVLEFKKPNRFYVNASGKRYAPAVGDTVIGIVTDKTADFYRIKLNSTTAAILPTLAFDGASKRNKPNLAIGAPVFGRIAACSKFMETELSCQGMKAGGASQGVQTVLGCMPAVVMSWSRFIVCNAERSVASCWWVFHTHFTITSNPTV